MYVGVEWGGAGRYSPGKPSALTHIVHYLSSYYTVFHSVIYNSVALCVHLKVLFYDSGADDFPQTKNRHVAAGCIRNF